MSVDIKVEGLEELLKQVEEMDKKGANIQGKALKRAGEYLKEEMRNEIIAKKLIKSGLLRDNIEVSGLKTKKNTKYIQVGPGKETAWRAKFVEYGTSKSKAYPFMAPTYERNKNKIQEIIKEELKKGLGLE